MIFVCSGSPELTGKTVNEMEQTSKGDVFNELLFLSQYHSINVSRETFFSKIQILVWQSCRIFSINSEILFGRMPEC